jgi:hypothetical protein
VRVTKTKPRGLIFMVGGNYCWHEISEVSAT